jgi:Domain of unknown function (DUF1707)
MNENEITGGVRASDAERERVATMVSDAAGEGRLTLAEAEQRMESIYAATYRAELDQYVADLPERPTAARGPAGRFPVRLRIHAAVAVVVSVLLIVRWTALDVPYFFPAVPMVFLFGSLLLHARMVSGPRRRWGGP